MNDILKASLSTYLLRIYLVVVTIRILEELLNHRVLQEAPVVLVLLLQQLLQVGDRELVLGEGEEGHETAGVECYHHDNKQPPKH